MDIIGQTNKVSVKINDNEITTERAEYPYDIDWDQQGNWEVNYSTDNILIDGQMPGATSAIMKWNSKSYDATLPSLTALTVIDGQTREVKDRFKSVDDSPYLMFYGADIKANPYSQEETPMFNFAELSNVMVEYATMGDDEFTTLEVEAKPEYNHLEGYGYCYEVDLSAISRSSENGWYDVRISIEDANGSSQVQTISPCFYIADTTGVEKVDEALAESEEYYDLTGRRIVTPEKGSIVICRKGAQVSKMVVR